MELTFKITTALFAFIALYFAWARNWDGVFASIVLAICSLLLISRFRAKDRLAKRKPAPNLDIDESR